MAIDQHARTVPGPSSDKPAVASKPGGKPHAELATTLAESIDLKRMMALETERRQLLREYLERQMIPNLHYYWLSETDRKNGRKPSISKEGALNLAELFRCRVEPEILEELREVDGHYTVKTRVRLFGREDGRLVATGDGLCSTHETKYAIRWLWPGEAEVAGIKEQPGVVTRQINTRRGRVTQYRDINERLPDEWNTVLKMSFKRGAVAAALILPCVSELFTQDLEEQLAEAAERVEDREEVATEEAVPKNRAEALATVKEAQKALRMGSAAVCTVASQILNREIKSPADLKDPEMIKLAVDLRAKVAAQAIRQTEDFEIEPAPQEASTTRVGEPAVEEPSPSEVSQADADRAARWAEAVASRAAAHIEEPPPGHFPTTTIKDPADLPGFAARAVLERRIHDALAALVWDENTYAGFVLRYWRKIPKDLTIEGLVEVTEELEGRALSGRSDPNEEAATDGHRPE